MNPYNTVKSKLQRQFVEIDEQMARMNKMSRSELLDLDLKASSHMMVARKWIVIICLMTNLLVFASTCTAVTASSSSGLALGLLVKVIVIAMMGAIIYMYNSVVYFPLKNRCRTISDELSKSRSDTIQHPA
jgi:hypothetical protein